MTRRTTAKPTLQQKPMACVEINYQGFLLPFADAQKLMEIMTRAVSCKQDYSGMCLKYVVEGQPKLALSVVMPDQVQMPTPEADSAVGARTTVVALPGQPRLRGPGSAS
jgi:hypothetical protein